MPATHAPTCPNHTSPRETRIIRAGAFAALALTSLASCDQPAQDPADPLVARGRDIFFNETFDGNGRTCATCHRAEENFTLTPAFIAALPADDPLFIAEQNPDLSKNFENPVLMRGFSLILENLDGFDDLEEDFTLRGIPHLLGLRVSVDSAVGPRTGWSGDGAPGDGSLRSFATGAVIQHFTRTTARVAGVDFRPPTDEELDALEAFQLSLGRQEDLPLPLPLSGIVAQRGQAIFLDNTLGKCNACHANAGANGDPAIFGAGAGNLNFNTGVEDLADQPADLTGEKIPPDDGFGTPGNGEFNTPPLVEAADTRPFFHNNVVSTIEGAVAFYNTAAFNNSPAGQLITQATGSGINLDVTQVEAVATFLRVINALENIRSARMLLAESLTLGKSAARATRMLALADIDDAVEVLSGGGQSPQAVTHLRAAAALTTKARRRWFGRDRVIREAIAELDAARAELIEDDASTGGRTG